MNGIGLMAGATLAVGVQLVMVGAATANTLSLWLGMPFAIAGFLGLADDLVFDERITKKLLGLK